MQVTLFFYIRAKGRQDKSYYAKKYVDLPAIPRIGETVYDTDATSGDDEAKKVVDVQYHIGVVEQILVSLQDETAGSLEDAECIAKRYWAFGWTAE